MWMDGGWPSGQSTRPQPARSWWDTQICQSTPCTDVFDIESTGLGVVGCMYECNRVSGCLEAKEHGRGVSLCKCTMQSTFTVVNEARLRGRERGGCPTI